MSNTSTSRQLINTFNAGPNVYVAYEPGDMDEAKHLFYDREIYGVVYIPVSYTHLDVYKRQIRNCMLLSTAT